MGTSTGNMRCSVYVGSQVEAMIVFFYIYTIMDLLTVLNTELKDANVPFTIIV
jgi:hypothetical protein